MTRNFIDCSPALQLITRRKLTQVLIMALGLHRAQLLNRTGAASLMALFCIMPSLAQAEEFEIEEVESEAFAAEAIEPEFEV